MSTVTNSTLSKGSLLQDGRYRILRVIGKGGFGITYRAVARIENTGKLGITHFDAPVVIKELFYKDYCSRDETTGLIQISNLSQKEQFEKLKSKLLGEGRLVYEKLRHPHIVKVNEIFEENNTAYIVMECIEGRDLQTIINENGRCTLQEIEHYLQGLFGALQLVHSQRVLHLDIKPSNILIDEDENAKLIDFGISGTYTESGEIVSTLLGAVSESFSPIEQYSADTLQAFHPQTDIYSLGATIYYALTGQKLPKATQRLLDDEEGFTDPSSIVQTLPPYIDLVLRKATALTIKKRFADIAAFRKAFFGEQQYQNFLQEAQRQEESNELEKALAEYENAYEILDADTGLKEKIAAIKKSLEIQRREKEEERRKQALFEQHYKQGQHFFEQSDFKQAEIFFLKALDLVPRHADAKNYLRKCELEMDRLEKERKEQEEKDLEKTRLVREKEVKLESLRQQGIELMKQKKYKEALEIFNKAVAVDPGGHRYSEAMEECRIQIAKEDETHFDKPGEAKQEKHEEKKPEIVEQSGTKRKNIRKILITSGSLLVVALIAVFIWKKMSGSVAVANQKSPATKETQGTEDKALENMLAKIYADMVFIQGGDFMMGSDKTPNESPAHKVHVNDFFISKYEVTREEWNTIMNDNKYSGNLKLPATNITWDDAQRFITTLNQISRKKYRLPTEDQWEYACVKGYSGIEISDLDSWNEANSGGQLHEVGTRGASTLELYDMLGNAYEWCQEAFSKYGEQADDSNIMVIRGGDYQIRKYYVAPRIRNKENRTKAKDNIGFRLAINAQTENPVEMGTDSNLNKVKTPNQKNKRSKPKSNDDETIF